MAKKKNNSKSKKNDFNNDPFSNLKGFAVSDLEKKAPKTISSEPPRQQMTGSFADEMAMLGVRKMNRENDMETDEVECLLPVDDVVTVIKDQTDDELFLEAMGALTVNFSDDLPDENPSPTAMPKRMKQLRQGRLTPEASLDLHGFQCAEAIEKLRHFLQNGQHYGWLTVLVITGKGLHSETGEPVLRNEVEQFLSGEGQKLIAEWGRAPKQYGGDGALILFLRKINK